MALSYEMGKLDGRREVVEWIEKSYFLRDTEPSTTAPSNVAWKFVQTSKAWQAKLKEWGL